MCPACIAAVAAIAGATGSAAGLTVFIGRALRRPRGFEDRPAAGSAHRQA